MGPNDAEIVRVFTQPKGGQVADITLSVGTDADIIVEVEAGNAAFQAGPQYKISVLLKDLTAGNNIPVSPATLAGFIQDAQWNSQAKRFTFSVAQTDLAGRAGNFVQVYASLLVGVSNLDASFVTSPVAILLP